MKPVRQWLRYWKGVIHLLLLKGEKPVSMGRVLEKQAARRPDSPLILFEEKRITYGQFNELANRYSHFLGSQGLKKGDAVWPP